MSLQTRAIARLASTRFTAAMERRVLHYIRKHSVLTPGERVLVAVSGGPDSTALLIVLSRLAPKLQLDLTIAHFDHQLRIPDEATADLDFVCSLTSALDLPLVHGAGDVRSRARKKHESTEDAARRLRYEFLGEKAADLGASAVALGHTLDDQAETVLLHLIRGAGLAGAAAMSPRSPWPFGRGPELTRPLLAVPREDTQRYCREIGLQPREDPTNKLPAASRNRVRHELLPLLRRLNPRIEEALARFAAAASADNEHLEDLAGEAFSRIAEPQNAAISLARNDLAALPLAVATRVFDIAFARLHGKAADLESAHIEALLEAVHRGPGTHSLPGGIFATVDQSNLILSRGTLLRADRIPEVSLAVPGRTVAGRWLIKASLEPPPRQPAPATPFEAVLDAQATGTDLTVRSRRPGDRLRPLGLGGEKKLQDILVDAKVPARDRDAVPLVCAADQIAWVAGHCLDERFALTGATGEVLHLRATRMTSLEATANG